MVKASSAHPFDRFVATLAALICLGLTLAIWIGVASYQPVWPLPALYFLELMLVAVLASALFMLGTSSARIILWAAVGIILAFAILGAFSVGLAYLPVVLLFAIVAFSSTIRHRWSLLAGLLAFLVAAVVQAAIMLAVAGLLI